jgi:hypothetical protein
MARGRSWRNGSQKSTMCQIKRTLIVSKRCTCARTHSGNCRAIGVPAFLLGAVQHTRRAMLAFDEDTRAPLSPKETRLGKFFVRSY